METRIFNYGGLSVMLFYSAVYGWLTTMAELAKGCGVDRKRLERTIEKYGLVRKGSVVQDFELGSKMTLIHTGRGPKPNLFWTVEGMSFVALSLTTPQCEMFRDEVLKTIKGLEQQGLVGPKEMYELMALVRELRTENAGLRQENSHIRALLTNHIERANGMETRLGQMESDLADIGQAQASTAGFALSQQKKTRHLRSV